jgi:hypothetical protein
MQPAKASGKGWLLLADVEGEAFVYAISEGSLKLDLRSHQGSFVIREIDLKTGAITAERPVSGQAELGAGKQPVAFWISRAPWISP